MSISSVKTGEVGTSLLVGNTFFDPPPAFESIATVSGTGSSNYLAFNNIPSGYKDLQIRFVGVSTIANLSQRYTFDINLTPGTTYSSHTLTTFGANSATSQSTIKSLQSVIPSRGNNLFENVVAVGIIDIYDYASTSKGKTLSAYLGVSPGTSGGISGTASLLSGLSYGTNGTSNPITTVGFTVATGSWTTSSRFALYGIKG